jgi:uncharacterized protein (TIGR03437 family)
MSRLVINKRQFYYNLRVTRTCITVLPGLIVAFAAGLNAQTVTYSEQIAPIIYGNCTTCHRTGQVTPFTLMSYSDVKQHALTIASVTQTGYMPPWKPEKGWMSFRDQRGLTAAQVSLIQQWVAQGMPQGDPSKEPVLPTFTDGWQLGTPDLVLTMPIAYSVAADGADIYRNFVLRTGLTTEKWIQAIELKPSARGAVHHVLFFADATGKARAMDGQDGQPGFPGFGSIFAIQAADPLNAVQGGLGGWVPGTTPEFLPSGISYHLPVGGDLVLQTHFHPDGKTESEQTTVGLYFAPTAPARTINQIQAPAFFGYQANIDIPAGVNNYMVRSSFTLPVDVDAFSVSAHCHYLGKGTRMTATLPTGEVKILLWIKDWDFNWQDTYIYKDLVPLPAGTRIDGELVYDNSSANPFNPFSPPKEVKFGENSTDEMGSLILNVLPHQQSDLTALETSLLVYTLKPAAAVGNKPLFISSGVVDAASEQSGAVSPGKIVVLYGNRLAQTGLTNAQVSGGKLATSLAGAQVLFDGTPAPLVYTTAGQVAAVVPYAVNGKAGTQVQVRNGTLTSDPVALPVVPSAPGLFSADTSGSGQGAILNFDSSVNSYRNPAAAGSVIVLYATGEGQTSPGGVDGLLANGPTYPKPVLPVSVTIGGVTAEVLYAGAAPSLVAGVMQVNARIPAGLGSGDQPVIVTVGSAQSQAGLTVSVK